VPPQNKPLPSEIHACRPFLEATLAEMPRLTAIVALGKIAHDSVVRACGEKLSRALFGHGKEHSLKRPDGSGVTLFDSYHCSRYNTNTGVLTPAMFQNVFAKVRAYVGQTA
jgi:uracil-DNA glycosylase